VVALAGQSNNEKLMSNKASVMGIDLNWSTLLIKSLCFYVKLNMEY